MRINKKTVFSSYKTLSNNKDKKEEKFSSSKKTLPLNPESHQCSSSTYSYNNTKAKTQITTAILFSLFFNARALSDNYNQNVTEEPSFDTEQNTTSTHNQLIHTEINPLIPILLIFIAFSVCTITKCVFSKNTNNNASEVLLRFNTIRLRNPYKHQVFENSTLFIAESPNESGDDKEINHSQV